MSTACECIIGMTDLIIGFTIPAIVVNSQDRQLQTAHRIISATENNISCGALGWNPAKWGVRAAMSDFGRSGWAGWGPWHVKLKDPCAATAWYINFYLKRVAVTLACTGPLWYAEDELFPKQPGIRQSWNVTPRQPPSHKTHSLSFSGSLSDHYLHNYMLSSEEKTNPQILRVN